MIDSLPPASILFLGALLVPFLRGRVLQAYLLALPVASLLHMLPLFSVAAGVRLELTFFDYTLQPVRIDRLSLVFGLIFHIALLLSSLYAIHVRDRGQHAATLVYAGAAIAAVFAGDLITLFVYWELTAIASVFLVWAGRTERSYRAGMRYLIVQIGSGVLLLAGIVLHVHSGGSLVFGHLGVESAGGMLILLAFGIKCAFPLLHNWLQDAYPEASITGTVVLSAFTTKLAVYALARGYAGTHFLVWIGLTMTLFPIFFAVIENNLRRVLAYSLNNQLGFMVVGIGIGTEMALNGTVAHAFSHILYKALLFMAMGAVLHRTGTIQASELGGLFRSMPWTAAFCIVGAMSISAFPLFSGFISKSLILTAAGTGEHANAVLLLGLLFASAGVMEHSGIKIPYFAFFAHDSGIRCKEAPWNMLGAMGITAALCIFIGVMPGPLYSLLPYSVQFEPYTFGHVVTQLQLLMFSALAFAMLVRFKFYPPELPSVNLDSDWIYRRLLPRFVGAIARRGGALSERAGLTLRARLTGLLDRVYRHHGPEGVFARTWATGSAVMWVAVLLVVCLIVYYT